MIVFKNINKIYLPAGHQALKNINLRIDQGEFVSIVGQSGAGKTTLVKILTAEQKPTDGTVFIGDWDITNIRHGEIPYLRRQIGIIFQDFKLLLRKTVFENVAFGLEVCAFPYQKIETIVPQVLRIVGLEGKEDRFPKELSGGEQQRVAIARALVHKPKILIADEPTGNLDHINAQDIIEILQKINEFGVTVLLLTHNKEVVNYLKRRVITLNNGLVVSDRLKAKYLI